MELRLLSNTATKQKQRTEILKLRRLLRESQNPLSLSLPLASPNPLSPTSNTPFPIDSEQSYFDDDFEDLELEIRWGRVQELVEVMKTRGEKGLEMKFEIPGVKVLGHGEEDGEVGDLSFDLDGEGISEMGDVSAEI